MPWFLFENTFITKSPGVVNFAGIMKIAIMLINTTFKDLTKVKRIRKKCIKMKFLFVFLDLTKIANF